MGVSVCRWWYLWLLAHSTGSPCKGQASVQGPTQVGGFRRPQSNGEKGNDSRDHGGT